MFDWLFPNKKAKFTDDTKQQWEYSEEPIYEREHRETMAIIEDILNKLDEIKTLIDEMKDKDYD